MSRPSKSSLVRALTAFPQNGVKQWEIAAARYVRFWLLPLRNPLHNVGRTIAPCRKSIAKSSLKRLETAIVSANPCTKYFSEGNI